MTPQSDINYVKTITGCEKEKEMESNLNMVGRLVSNLKIHADEMGKEIDMQNVILTDIETTAKQNEIELEQINRRCKKQLNNNKCAIL